MWQIYFKCALTPTLPKGEGILGVNRQALSY